MLAETERGSRWPLQRRRRSARARRTRPGSRAPSHEDRFWTYLPTWSVIGRLRILGFAPASVSDAQMVPVGQQCHSGLPTGLTSEADVEGISLEVLQLALSQLTIVEPCLDVSAQNALPMTVSLGESPQHEVVQDWRNQLGALDLYRFVRVGVSATMHVFRVGLFSDRHFALIRGCWILANQTVAEPPSGNPCLVWHTASPRPGAGSPVPETRRGTVLTGLAVRRGARRATER